MRRAYPAIGGARRRAGRDLHSFLYEYHERSAVAVVVRKPESLGAGLLNISRLVFAAAMPYSW